jgi:hypothetical protein
MNAPLRRLRLPVACLALVVLFGASAGRAVGAESPRVTSFTLINADTDQPIAGFDPIPQNATLNLGALPTRHLNVRANAPAVDSVRFTLDGQLARVEKNAPYALAGNTGANYASWTPGTGSHVLAATTTLAGSTTSQAATLNFVVVDPPTTGPPPPPTTGGRCGSTPAAPAGWQRRVTSNFSETTPLGRWPGPVAAQDWRSRTAGYRDSSGRGIYHSGKTVSEHDGLLDVWVHSEGGVRYVAAPIPKIGDTVGQRISLCMRADYIPGYKIAFMLWPDLGPGNFHGEIDYPEGKLLPSGVGNAFMHYDPKPASGRAQDAYSTGQSLVNWHVYTVEWDPGRNVASFLFDGRLIGRSAGARVPNGPMHYIMQIETYMSGQALPAAAGGHLQVDWVTIEVPAGAARAASSGGTPPQGAGVT